MRRGLVVLSVCLSTVATCTVGIGLGLWAAEQLDDASQDRAHKNCVVQREARIEGNKRYVYTRAMKLIIENFPSTREFLKNNHPDLYPLPVITALAVPDCDKIHPEE
jgi:hypothetical protein